MPMYRSSFFDNWVWGDESVCHSFGHEWFRGQHVDGEVQYVLLMPCLFLAWRLYTLSLSITSLLPNFFFVRMCVLLAENKYAAGFMLAQLTPSPVIVREKNNAKQCKFAQVVTNLARFRQCNVTRSTGKTLKFLSM